MSGAVVAVVPPTAVSAAASATVVAAVSGAVVTAVSGAVVAAVSGAVVAAGPVVAPPCSADSPPHAAIMALAAVTAERRRK